MEKWNLWSDALDTPIHWYVRGQGFKKHHVATCPCCLFSLLQSPLLEMWGWCSSQPGALRSLRQSRVLFWHLPIQNNCCVCSQRKPLHLCPALPSNQTDREGCWKTFLSWLLAWDPPDISFNTHSTPAMWSVFPCLCTQHISIVASVS